ncbi:hypothetical protein [Oenococcus oeni]|uniref:hypothetical protein n=1 Tax=Oenococcus oeni TaxID=1247 RepID=UPI0010B7DAC7|nr:hypothetical protein [Oenococcus oeni]SYW13969.1 hypothetical protein OENI_240011 [Oenococcus oeni]
MLEKEFTATTPSAGLLKHRFNSLAAQVTEFSTEVVELKKASQDSEIAKKIVSGTVEAKKISDTNVSK